MFIGIANTLSKFRKTSLPYIKDNLKLYLDFKSNRLDTLKFPCGGSTSFDGSNDGIDTGNIFSGGETQATFSAWIWADETGTSTDKLVGQTDESSNAADPFIIFWVHSSNAIEFWFSDGGGTNYRYIASSAVTANTWHHLACTADLSTGVLKMYLDGVDLGLTVNNNASPPSSVTANTTTNYIGQGRSTGGDMWKGKVANMAIWKRVLEPEEIQSIKNKSYSQLGSVEKTSLVMWQSLDSVDATGYMDTPGTGTGAITTSFPTNIYLNSHGTTEYTEVMANNGNLTTQGAWTIENGGTDSAFADTGVYSEGAFKIKNQIIAKLAINSTNDSVLEALIVGQLYKFEITYTRVDGEHAQSWYMGLSQNIHDGAYSNIIFKEGYWNNDDDGAPEKTITGYFFHQTGNNFLRIRSLSSIEIQIKTISIKKVSNNAGGGGISITNHNSHYNATLTQGATTTTSVYGGNVPILPRAVSNEYGEAEKIGNGSAFFTVADDDYIDFGDFQAFTTQMSITAWVKFNAVSNTQAIIGHFDYPNNQRSWSLAWLDDTTNYLRFFVSGDGSSYKYNRVEWTPTAKEWYHISATYNAGTSKLYINGIEQTVTAESSQPTSLHNSTGSMFIGAVGNSSTNADHFDGNISQVGLWQGLLSQEKIQKIYESTSYQNLSADIKSTLGSSEITSASNTTFSGVTSNDWVVPADVTKSFSNDQMVFTMDDDSPTGYVAQLSASNFVGGSGIRNGLLKVTLDVDSTTTGTYSIDNAGGLVTAFLFSTSLSIGVNTIYKNVTNGSSGSYFRLLEADVSTGDKLVLNSFEVKEVTNDIVAFYPLDSDSSISALSGTSNNGVGITNNLTTGETLGDEIISANSTSEWGQYGSGGSEADIANGVALTTGSDSRNAYRTVSGLTDGKLYKLSVDAYYSGSVDDCKIEIIPGSGSLYTPNLTTTSTNYVIYFVKNSSTMYILGNNFETGNVLYIQNLSVKEVTSNTGVLK